VIPSLQRGSFVLQRSFATSCEDAIPSLTSEAKAALPSSRSVLSLIAVALWFAILTGLIEGIGLLAFQRINWARWGPMMHVSAPILWISPVVDVAFFLVIAGLIAAVVQFSRRIPAVRVLAFVLAFLAMYDWLTLTNRLYHVACVLLAFGVAVAFTRWLAKHEDTALRFWKKSALWVLATWVLVFGVIEGGNWLREQMAVGRLPRAAAGAPNVLVIVVDTLRADHVSVYGYPRPTTPNFDRLAKQGVMFENAISASSWSLPSHVSLVTGRYLFEHGVGNVQPEPWLGWGKRGLGSYPTLGEALEREGYRTGAFSANRTYFSHDLGFGRGFVHFEDYFDSPADAFVRTLYGREFARIYLKRSDHSLVKRILRAIGFTSLLDQDAEGSGSYGGAFGIRKHANVVNHELLHWIDHDRQRPFFAFLNYFDVHDPYGGPHGYPKPAWEQNTSIDRYDDGVKYVDDCLGHLMQQLRQRGLDQRTLVIVTSDHGESLGQHHLETHGRSLYWELVHVPLMFWYPGHVPVDIKISQPVTNSAIAVTVMDLLNPGRSSVFPGKPLDLLWQSPDRPDWPTPLSELAQNKYPGLHDKEADALIPTATTGAMKSLITPQWQIITHTTRGDQLYDWVHDPGELNDVIATPEGQKIAAGLKAEIQGIVKQPKSAVQNSGP
jgi:arylsulfatase A-like enzyme